MRMVCYTTPRAPDAIEQIGLRWRRPGTKTWMDAGGRIHTVVATPVTPELEADLIDLAVQYGCYERAQDKFEAAIAKFNNPLYRWYRSLKSRLTGAPR